MLHNLDSLIGKKINKIYIGSKDPYGVDGNIMVFDVGNKLIGYECCGDCCSDSYVSNIITNVGSSIQNILGQTVSKIIEIPNEEGQPTLQESDEIYGYEIYFEETEDILFVTYRNSSNGYYGGWINELNEGSLMNILKEAKQEYKEITEPFESKYV